MDVRFDREKLEELVLYIAQKAEDDPRFGKTKLNKLLFFCDFWAYAELGAPITGSTYERRELGPMSRELPGVQRDMLQCGQVAIQERLWFNRRQRRLIALRPADLGHFTAYEIALIDRVIDELWEHNATGVSALSHELIGWQAAQEGETIPYATVLADPSPLTAEEIAFSQKLAADHGWLVSR